MIYLEKEYKENIRNGTDSNPSNESIQQANEINTKYIRFSSASFILGCIAIGLFSWLGWLLIPYLGEYVGKIIGILAFNSFFLICTTIGMVLGALSIRKERRRKTLLGLIFNSIGVIIHIFLIIVHTVAYYF